MELTASAPAPGPKAKEMLDLHAAGPRLRRDRAGFGVQASRATTAADFAKQLERAIAEPGPALIETMVPSIV